jgi:hypothetical protein
MPKATLGSPPRMLVRSVVTPFCQRKATSEQVRIEPAVMSSEIERLRDLEGFLKFASIPD